MLVHTTGWCAHVRAHLLATPPLILPLALTTINLGTAWVVAAATLNFSPAVSAAAAFGPQVLGDTLTLLDGEEDEEPYGLFPPLMGQGGLTPAAEMWNGRLAMLGLIAVVMTSLATGKDILEVVDIGVGGLLFK